MEEETLSIEDPDPPEERVTVVGFRDADRPDGETVLERETAPEKLFRLARLIVAVPEEPPEIVRLDGLLETLKSGVELGPTVTVFDVDPLTPFESTTDNCAA